jgi:hypothetical protein
VDNYLVAEGGKAAVSPPAELDGRNRWIQAGRALEVTTTAVAAFADAVFKREHDEILASASPAVQAGLAAAASAPFTQYIKKCPCGWKPAKSTGGPFDFLRFFRDSLSPSASHHAANFGAYDEEGMPTKDKGGRYLPPHQVEKYRKERVQHARKNGIQTPDEVSKANDVKILQSITAAASANAVTSGGGAAASPGASPGSVAAPAPAPAPATSEFSN